MMKGVDSPRDAPTRGGGCAALLDGNLGDPSQIKMRATLNSKSMPAKLMRIRNASIKQHRKQTNMSKDRFFEPSWME